MKTNRKSYMAYQMAATAVTLNALKVIHRLLAFSNAIRRTSVIAFYMISTDSVLAVLCVGRASCMNRETTDKRLVFARNTNSG